MIPAGRWKPTASGRDHFKDPHFASFGYGGVRL
jgi:hypothetical protein